MILVVTGTHHQPFDRLVRAADGLAAGGRRVFVQRGASRVPLRAADGADWLAPAELDALADDASVIVGHGGPGTLFLAWDRGRVPVAVPRDPRRGEHVDDHQQRFVRSLGSRVVAVEAVADLPAAVDRVAGRPPRAPDDPDARTRAYAARLGHAVDALLAARGSRG